MKESVVIIGGGIIGLLTAYFLNKKGFDVTIIERRNGVALGASFANGSQFSFSHIIPRMFYKKHQLISDFFAKPSVGVFINKGNSEAKRLLSRQKEEVVKFETNLASLIKFSDISKVALNEILEKEDISRHIRDCGIIHMYSDKKSFARNIDFAKKINQPFSILSTKQMLSCEVNIASLVSDFVGGIYFKDDKTSNCHDLCKVFETMLKERGVKFIFKHNIKHLKTQSEKVISVVSDSGEEFSADIFVLANGVNINSVSSTLGLSFDIHKVRGYSYTFNMENSNYTPYTGLIDDERKLVFSYYKTYLRIAGFFDIGVEDEAEIATRMKVFENTIYNFFPLLKRNQVVHKWTENRPFTANSTPIVGMAEGFSNLLINTGYGSLGFTFAPASGKIISELI